MAFQMLARMDSAPSTPKQRLSAAAIGFRQNRPGATGSTAPRVQPFYKRGRLRGVTPHSVRDATCLYTTTAEGRFVIDRHPESPNVTVVPACSGHGFEHSAALGEAIADSVLGRAPRFDLTSFATLQG